MPGYKIGTYPDAEHHTTLLFGSISTYDTATHVVQASQFYEQYDSRGILQEKQLFKINFILIDREEFETLTSSMGFKTVALYGDNEYAPFQTETSPFMIWVLEK